MADKMYTRDEVSEAVNNAVNLVAGNIEVSDSDQDMLNLIVNAAMTLLDFPGASMHEVITANYAEDPENVLGWCGA